MNEPTTDSKEYILRKPVTCVETTVDTPRAMVSIPHYMDGREWTTTPMLADTFEDLFVEFDREQLKQQLAEIISTTNGLDNWYRFGLDFPDNKKIFESITDDILALFLGEET